MNRRIGKVGIVFVALSLAACGSLSTQSLGAGAGSSSKIFIGSETITLRSLPMGREQDGYTCGTQRTLVCNDNGWWAKCRCSD